ncbi:hypothetical protein PanNE5_29400 [Pandoraea sp. NE5]|nr:hypothetical protein PanNE5_29400 [Pandoraea sp. NE5]
MLRHYQNTARIEQELLPNHPDLGITPVVIFGQIATDDAAKKRLIRRSETILKTLVEREKRLAEVDRKWPGVLHMTYRLIAKRPDDEKISVGAWSYVKRRPFRKQTQSGLCKRLEGSATCVRDHFDFRHECGKGILA